MFINSTHLPQVLSADSYHAAEQHDLEWLRIFRTGWHFVGTFSDLRRAGDFLTAELFGRPLLIYRTKDGVRSFLNVCAHRFAMLTSQPCGHMPTLRCQYHGWEYDESGHTRKIPDARSFRPMQDGQFGLTEVRTEVCGQLIFVCFSADAPDLATSFGPAYAGCRELFTTERRQFLKRDLEVACNWKVKIENTLESYHIDCVHRRTFQRSPAAENCSHQLAEGGSLFTTNEPPASRLQRSFDSIIYGVIGVPRDRSYEHSICHPNFMFGKAGIFTWVEVIVPISPIRSRIIFRMFSLNGSRRNPVSRLTAWCVNRLGGRFAMRALEEDLSIVVDVQRGLQSADQPAGGVISIREERLFHFQEYVRAATSS